MFLEREYDLRQGSSPHFTVMAREGMSQSPQLATLPEARGIVDNLNLDMGPGRGAIFQHWVKAVS